MWKRTSAWPRTWLLVTRTSLTLGEGMTGLLENDFINIKDTSLTNGCEFVIMSVPIRGNAVKVKHQ